MPDRTLIWGNPSDSGTRWQTQDADPDGGGNFVVLEDRDNNTIYLEYNPITGQWEFAQPVDMGDNDLSSIGTATASDLVATNSLTDASGTEHTGELADSSDVSSIQSSGDVVHDNTQGGTAGNPHADSAALSDVSDIQASGDVDHDATSNRTHSGDSLTPDSVDTDTLNSADLANATSGTAPVAQGDGTLAMETVDTDTAIDLIDVETAADLPDPDTLSKPTIAYIDEEDDYLGIFQS